MFNLRSKLKGEAMALQVEYNPESLYHFPSHGLDKEDGEVYQASGGGPGSIEDIWKKFELIPTPPLSPSRQAGSSGASSPTCLTSSGSAADTLQSVSDILDTDNSRTTPLFVDNSCSNLKSNLIQDCMWGSHISTEKTLRTKFVEDVYDTPCSTPPPFLGLDYVTTDCVDPSSVFSYPINKIYQESDSSSSEDEDEIDVVSIEKPVKRKASTLLECNNDDENNNNSDQEAKQDNEPAAKKPKSVHNNKRLRLLKEPQESAREMSNRLAAKDKLEDPECKRTVHNVLERKRRNDLKYSFQVLRDSVPELKGSERAPKVAILKKATDCILKLKSREEGLLKQKDILEKKHQALLLRKLKLLEKSSV